jgi:hypothetical protein
MSEPPRPTRRALLGTAAGAAGAVTVGAAAGCQNRAPGTNRTTAAAPRSVTAENSLPGDPGWRIRRLGAPHAIMGYAGRASVLPGEPVHLYVSTTAREFTVKAFRIGWYGGDLARRVWQSGSVRGHRQRAAVRDPQTNTVHTNWGISLTMPTAGWPAGSYLLRLDADTGAQRYVPLTVRSASTAGKVVIRNAVETWQAYNLWGGYDLYTGPGGYADRAVVVSLDRPYDKSGANSFLVFELKLINLAERTGVPLAYLTSMDIASDGHVLDGASALFSPGHDEYWTPYERAHVTAARDAGVNLAFLGANAIFRRTRLEPTRLGPDRRVVCYKTSYQRDPMYGKHNWLVTNDYPAPPDPNPEQSLIGTQYGGFPAIADFVVTAPDAWMFRHTGVRAGTRFRALVGVEFDRIDRNYPLERPTEVVAHSPLVLGGTPTHSDAAYYTHHGGAGVFSVGTMRWVASFARPLYHWGITRACSAFTRRVTANVLRAFADGPAAAKHPARDNLSSLHL